MIWGQEWSLVSDKKGPKVGTLAGSVCGATLDLGW